MSMLYCVRSIMNSSTNRAMKLPDYFGYCVVFSAIANIYVIVSV